MVSVWDDDDHDDDDVVDDDEVDDADDDGVDDDKVVVGVATVSSRSVSSMITCLTGIMRRSCGRLFVWPNRHSISARYLASSMLSQPILVMV